MNQQISNSVAANHRRRKTLKRAGVIVLLLGALGAGVVYWLGTRSPDLTDDLTMARFDKANSRQMAELYGASGLLMEDLMNSLRRPGIQAIAILTISGVIAAGCFIFARFPASDDDPNFFKPSSPARDDKC